MIEYRSRSIAVRRRRLILGAAKLLLLALLASPVGGQVEYHYRVVGRAIDQHGEPVPFARIVMAPGRDNKGGDFIYTGSADKQGRIYFEVNDSTLEKLTRIVYVTGPAPPGTVTLIEPPFNEYPLMNPFYLPQQILIRKDAEVDVGDVRVRVFYQVITVVLRDRFGHPLLRTTDMWRKAVLRVRDEQGRFIEETSMTEKRIRQAVNLSESSVAIALPQGRWFIDVSPSEAEGWLTSRSPIDVKASNTQQELTLKTR